VPLVLLFLIFIVVPLVELYVIIQVGGAIGVLPTLAILVADSIIGAWLLRHQGRAAWVRFNQALSQNKIPHREIIDGVLIIFGGAFLLTPGFITDIFGLILLIPPTRAIVRGIATRILTGRIAIGARAATWGYNRTRGRGARPGPGPGRPPPGPPPRGPAPSRGPHPGDIEGTAHEVRDEEGRLPGGETEGPREP
jgi:UPF0716 protein FxsA